MAAARPPRPSYGADAKSRWLPGEIELGVPPWTYLGDTKLCHLSCYLRLGRKSSRKMRWRTAPAPWQKRLLHYRSTTSLRLLNVDLDAVLAKVAVKVAVKDAAAVAVKAAVIIAIVAVPTLAATLLGPASGYEIQFFLRQFDRV